MAPNLAEVYRAQGRLADAEAQLQATLAELPAYAPALQALANVYGDLKRWPELEDTASRLDALPGETGEGAVVRARGLLARQEFAAARGLLETTVARFPQSLRARVHLSHVRLREGMDLVAAEKALRAVLALDPENAEAGRNLVLLIQERGANGG